MEIAKKQLIATALQAYVEAKGSQNKAANSLNGVSNATISQILNNNWDLIADPMWNKISNQIGFREEWEFITNVNPTSELIGIFEDAQQNGLTFGVTADAGTGKTATAKHYSLTNPNAFHLECNEYLNKGWFMDELMKSIGLPHTGMQLPQKVNKVVTHLKSLDHPLIIIDEADKLQASALLFFITFYNKLNDACGIILMATEYLEKKVLTGLQNDRRGYREMYSRLGRKFIEIDPVSFTDVVKICSANGVENQKDIKTIWEDCEGDLRRVKRLVHATKKMIANAV